MSSKPHRAVPCKRIAATGLEHDGDFRFARVPKRRKTEEGVTAMPPPGPMTTPAVLPTTKRPGMSLASPENPVRQHRASVAGAYGPSRNRSCGTTRPNDAKTPRRPPEPAQPPAIIGLPSSKTLIIDGNKEMQEKGSWPTQRSSLGSRGRRASQVLCHGHSAAPHKEVGAADFYKYIPTEGVPEPQRMRQLLAWCGQRALPERPRNERTNTRPILAAHVIKTKLSNDFVACIELLDWRRRDSNTPVATVPRKQNPRNLELDAKARRLEARLQRLQQEKNAWESVRRPYQPKQPLFGKLLSFPTAESASRPGSLPETCLLSVEESRMCTYLLAGMEPLDRLRARTEARLRGVQKVLEFQIDTLVDNVHKLEQRVAVAGRQADKVLGLSAARLKGWEDEMKRRAGTRDTPIMAVLLSLGQSLGPIAIDD